MANEISRSNLVVAGVLALFLCPALFTSMLTTVVPAVSSPFESWLCDEGTRLVQVTEAQRYSRQGGFDNAAYCVDAAGERVSDDVHPKAFGLVYAGVFLIWLGGLFALRRALAAPHDDRASGSSES